MLRARGKPVAQLSNLGGMTVGAVVGTVVGTALTLYRSGLPKRGIGSVSHGKEALDMLQGGSLDTSLAPINRFDAWRAKNPKHQLRRGSYVHTARMNTGFVARADAPDVLAAASKVISAARAPMASFNVGRPMPGQPGPNPAHRTSMSPWGLLTWSESN